MTATEPAAGPDPVGVVGYAYPWDVLGDPGFLDRVHALGITRVALAAAYHTTRAATPLHPQRRLVDARHAALYRPVRPEAWADRRLVPAPAAWVEEDDSFGQAARILREGGIEVAAWVVLTHSSRLGSAHPEHAVVNCFDEPYPYALCPRSPEVREYAATLAAEAVRGADVVAIVLEACGQLGLQHGGHHEKTDGAYDETAARLLSICCCRWCREAWRADGLVPDEVAASLRSWVEETLGNGDGGQTGDPARTYVLNRVLRLRHAATDSLRAGVIAAAREAAPGPLEVALHAQPDPWVTGALPGLTPSAPDDVDVVVAQCWATGQGSIDNARRLVEGVADRAVPAAYVTVLPPTVPEEFAPHLDALEAVGVRQIHLYHLGLTGPARAELLGQAGRRLGAEVSA
ncbi:hypothetical protein [Nocardioides insulae]|uniref:hypothetical protein n=1 Tax=Nocardioides insulae TaxID=394734 RepID=UPI0004052869|nr:hypothetical protein [Nocardioides insulae]